MQRLIKLTDNTAQLSLFVLSLSTCSIILFFLVKFPIEGPYKDTYAMINIIRSFISGGLNSVSFSELISPHAGAHRILLLRLVELFDIHFFSGRNTFFYILSIASQLLIAGLFLAAYRRSTHSPSTYKLLLICIPFLFSQTLLMNFLSPINSSWFIGTAFMVTSIYLCISYTHKPNNYWLLLAWISVIMASFSNFSGILMWPTLALILWPNNKRAFAATSLFAAIFTSIYLTGIQADTVNIAHSALAEKGAGLARYLQYLHDAPGFVLQYLGSPLSRDLPFVAGTLSLVAIIYIFTLGTQYLRHKKTPFIEAFCLFIAVSMILVALSTSFGRIILRDPTAERYQTITMLFWAAVSVLIFYQLNKLDRPLKKLYFPTLIIFLLVFSGMQQLKSLQNNINANSKYTHSKVAAMVGITNWRLMSGINAQIEGVNRVRKHHVFLSEHKLGFYSGSSDFNPYPKSKTNTKPPKCTIHLKQTTPGETIGSLTAFNSHILTNEHSLSHQHWLYNARGEQVGALAENLSMQRLGNLLDPSPPTELIGYIQEEFLNGTKPVFLNLTDHTQCSLVYHYKNI